MVDATGALFMVVTDVLIFLVAPKLTFFCNNLMDQHGVIGAFVSIFFIYNLSILL